MKSNIELPQQNGETGIGVAALGGGGAGTVLVGIAQLLPETDNWRTFLIVIAPAFSVAISSFWIWITAEYNKYRKEKAIRKTVSELRQYLNEQLSNSDIPQEMKKQYEKQLLQLEEKSFQQAIQIIQ